MTTTLRSKEIINDILTSLDRTDSRKKTTHEPQIPFYLHVLNILTSSS